ncbi:MAG: hypothetical protein H6742_16085 [Alphaproteobacteria bacterium]|nr:hypothetical protein [Alphaproteobacteria bacterium]
MLALILAASTASAGPWIKDPGHAYVKAGYLRFAADEYVDPSGRASPGGMASSAYVGHTVHLYGEVGVAPHLQLVANLPFVLSRNTVGDVAYIQRGFGDAEVGVASGLVLADAWPVSLTLSAKLPLYDNGDLAPYGYVGERFPALGDGQVDLTAMAEAGRGFALGGFQGWAAIGSGYRHRTEWWLGDSTRPDRTIGDGIPWRAQAGWSPRLDERELGWLSVEASGLYAFAGPGDAEDATTKEWLQLSTGLGARVGHGLAVELGASTTPYADASSTGWSVSGGLSWSR